MHKCTSATITVHICTVTIALLYIILIISNLLLFFLSLLHLQNQRPHHLLLPLIHTLPKTQNQKSTTKSITKSTTDTTKPNTPAHRHTNRDRESGPVLGLASGLARRTRCWRRSSSNSNQWRAPKSPSM